MNLNRNQSQISVFRKNCTQKFPSFKGLFINDVDRNWGERVRKISKFIHAMMPVVSSKGILLQFGQVGEGGVAGGVESEKLKYLST